MKNANFKRLVLLAMLLIPGAAWAQHGVHAPAPKAPAAVAPDVEHGEHGEPGLEGLAWSADEWLALEEDGAIWEEQGDPASARRFKARAAHHGPGGGGAMFHGRRAGRHAGMGLHRRFAQLDLTDAQRTKLHDLHEAAMRKGVQRRADAELARMDLHKQMRADSPNSASANAAIDKIARLQADGLKARFDTYMQARALLTPEQLKQLQQGGHGKGVQPKSGEGAK